MFKLSFVLVRVSFRPTQVLFLWDLNSRTVRLHKKINKEGGTSSSREIQITGPMLTIIGPVVLLKKTWLFIGRVI